MKTKQCLCGRKEEKKTERINLWKVGRWKGCVNVWGRCDGTRVGSQIRWTVPVWSNSSSSSINTRGGENLNNTPPSVDGLQRGGIQHTHNYGKCDVHLTHSWGRWGAKLGQQTLITKRKNKFSFTEFLYSQF